jgi:hypothetical protein
VLTLQGTGGSLRRDLPVEVMHVSLGLKHRSACLRWLLRLPIPAHRHQNALLVVPRVAHTDAYIFSLRVLVDTRNPSRACPGQVTDMSLACPAMSCLPPPRRYWSVA